MNHAVNTHVAFTLGRFFSKNVATKTFLVSNFAGSRYFEPLFGA
jgi:hypothetical protein